MDILSLPLDRIDYNLGKMALTIALRTLENNEQYSYQWFGTIFRGMPTRFKDYDMCWWAYNNDPDLVGSFPDEHQYYNMFYKLNDRTTVWLNDVPVKLRDSRMCNKFLEMNSGGDRSMQLGDVPIHLRTFEMCESCFKKSVGTIIYFPPEYITYEKCLATAKGITSIFPDDFLKVVPLEFQTDEFWVAYVSNNWYHRKNILDFVPMHLRNDEFVKQCSQTDNWWANLLINHVWTT